MNLSEFYNSLLSQGMEVTDKGTDHNYIDGYYNDLLTPLKEKDIKILEIGIDKGYSITLLRDFLANATIECFDTHSPSVDMVKNLSRVSAHYLDAYSQEVVSKYSDNFFDIIIDDGPHSLHSQLLFVERWLSKLKVGGVAIIEDLQNPDTDYVEIVSSIQDAHKYTIRSVDLRQTKLRRDDYIIEIIKNEA